MQKNKRLHVYLDNGEEYHFGLKGGKTFVDHGDSEKRKNYIKRHLANPLEKKLIQTLTPSPALFSAYILWGPYQSIQKNMEYLADLFESKAH